MVEFHREQDALATLAVRPSESSRQLLFDAGIRFNSAGGVWRQGCRTRDGAPRRETQAWRFPAFTSFRRASFDDGRRLARCAARSTFSDHPEYLRLAAGGEKILACPADNDYWRDLGTVASLDQAAADIEHNLLGDGSHAGSARF